MTNDMSKLLNLPTEVETEIIEKIRDYIGQPGVLESALGALIISQHYGWRVSKLTHTPSTYSKYEKILGLKFQEHSPEETEFSRKCNAFKIAKKLNSFWAVVRGKIHVDNKTHFEELDSNS